MSQAKAECGTNSGYYYHHRRAKREPPCRACRDAHNAYQRQRKARGDG